MGLSLCESVSFWEPDEKVQTAEEMFLGNPDFIKSHENEIAQAG